MKNAMFYELTNGTKFQFAEVGIGRGYAGTWIKVSDKAIRREDREVSIRVYVDFEVIPEGR